MISVEAKEFIEKNYAVLKSTIDPKYKVKYRSDKHVKDMGCDTDAKIIFGDGDRDGNFVGIFFGFTKKQFKLWFPNDRVMKMFGVDDAVLFDRIEECAKYVNEVLKEKWLQ